MCVCVHTCVVVSGDQKRVSDILEIELQACVTCLIWKGGSEPQPSRQSSKHS